MPVIVSVLEIAPRNCVVGMRTAVVVNTGLGYVTRAFGARSDTGFHAGLFLAKAEQAGAHHPGQARSGPGRARSGEDCGTE